MIKKKAALLLAGGSTIALAASGAAYWWAQRVNPDELPIGVSVVPQNALITLSFSTDEGQWHKLRQYGTSTTQAIVDQNLAQWRDRLFTANGFDYQQDIQPWVGNEVTVAFLPSGASPAASPAASQSAVVLLPIANADRAQQILTKRQNSSSEVGERDYKGIPIREFKGSEHYFSTILNQRLIAVSQDAKAIEQIIDTDKGGASIAKTQGYSGAIDQIKATQPFMQIYVNVPAANAALAANSIQPFAQGLLPLQNNQGLVGAVSLEPDGIRLQGVGWLSADRKIRYKVENRAERMPSLLPADTLLMASGGSLKQFWQDYSQGVTTGSAAFLRQGINSTTGLDFDKDLIAWMDGEFSLSLLPTAASGATPASAGLVFLVQASDRRAADAALDKLDQSMSSQYGFQVSKAEVKGSPVVNWVSRFEAVTATRGWLNGNVAFLTLSLGRGSPLANAIVPQPESTLAADPRFQKAIASQLTPNNGHFFANVDRLANANSALSLPYLPPNATSFLQAMQAIGVTGAVATDRTSRYEIFVTLGKTENNKPLPAAPTPPPSLKP